MMSNKGVIVLDPGHGDLDSGAYNAELDIKEKNINLAVALSARQHIRIAKQSLLCVLTRSRDTFPTLQERCQISNESGAEAFVSIHCNSREIVGKHGIEVEIFHYPWSKNGRSLAECVLRNYIAALKVLTHGTNLGVYSRGIKKERFWVLRHTNAPAVLLELGFLCDAEEAKFLVVEDKQKAIARSIIAGIEDYFAV